MKYTVFVSFAFINLLSQERTISPEQKQMLMRLIDRKNSIEFKSVLFYYQINNLDQDIVDAAQKMFRSAISLQQGRPSLLSPAGQILTMVYQRCPAQTVSTKLIYPFRVVHLVKKN